jgi:hypothetical protein
MNEIEYSFLKAAQPERAAETLPKAEKDYSLSISRPHEVSEGRHVLQSFEKIAAGSLQPTSNADKKTAEFPDQTFIERQPLNDEELVALSQRWHQ